MNADCLWLPTAPVVTIHPGPHQVTPGAAPGSQDTADTSCKYLMIHFSKHFFNKSHGHPVCVYKLFSHSHAATDIDMTSRYYLET